jgi:hypothetical protein
MAFAGIDRPRGGAGHIMDVTIAGIYALDAPKEDRRARIAAAFERQLAEVVFRDPAFHGRRHQLGLEMKISILHLAQRYAGQVAVTAPVRLLWRRIVVSARLLVLFGSCRLFAPQPVCLARLSVPSLDETGQETQSPEGSFKSHCSLRIQPFRLRCKRFMSRDSFQHRCEYKRFIQIFPENAIPLQILALPYWAGVSPS